MTSLHDVAIDLINDAKESKDVNSKLYSLEQIKEIIFHRDSSILSELAPEIFDGFMLERSSAIRKFLVTFASDWLQREFSAAVALSLTMFGFFLATDSGDGALRQIANELTKIYDQVAMHIASLPVKTTRAGSGGTATNAGDPKSQWGNLRTVVSRLIDMISSDRSEQLRTQSLRLAENIIIFGLPAEQLSLDPRLARSRGTAAGGSGDASKSVSSMNIPLTHPFIDRKELEQEAESIFSKMLLWAAKGGPQGHPFTSSQMSQLGVIIANIGSLRPKKSGGAATALTVLLQGKGNMCHQMTGNERDQLARSIQKLVRAAVALPDPDNLMGKLRTALDGLVALGLGSASGPSGSHPGQESVLTKRGHRSGGGEEDEADLDEVVAGELGGSATTLSALRASAKAAVDAAENSLKLKASKGPGGSGVTEGALGSDEAAAAAAAVAAAAAATAASTVAGASAVPGAFAAGALVTVDTELAADLSDFPETPPSVALAQRLVAVQAAPTTVSGALGPLPSSTQSMVGVMSSSGMVFKPTAPTADVYSDMALKSIRRVLESFDEVKNCGEKAVLAHLKLTARMVVSLALQDLAEVKPQVRVPIVASISPLAAASASSSGSSSSSSSGASGGGGTSIISTGSLLENVPMDVTMPKALWLVLSHALSLSSQAASMSAKGVQTASQGLPKEKVELILFIAREIFSRIRSGTVALAGMKGDGDGDGGGMGALGDGRLNGAEDPARVHPFKTLYAAVCAAVLSRTLHGVPTRAAAREIALGLPAVPPTCLNLLKLLVYTGTKPTAPIQAARRDKDVQPPRNRGTRAEALFLLGQLVFSDDEFAGVAALQHILWCSLADDFEIRSKSIALAVGEIMPAGDWAFEAVSLFALQAMVACVGPEVVARRVAAVRASFAGEKRLMHQGPHRAEGSSSSTAMVVDGGSGEEGGGEGNTEGEEGEDAVLRPPTLSLASCSDLFDMGASFQGVFPACPPYSTSSTSTSTPGAKERAETHIRKSVQLLSQVCLAKPGCLVHLFGLYGAAAAVVKEEARRSAKGETASAPGDADGAAKGGGSRIDSNSSSTSSSSRSITTTTTSSAGQQAKADPPTTAATGASAAPAASGASAKQNITNKHGLICAIIQETVDTAVPAVAKRVGSPDVFALLAGGDSTGTFDPLARPLLERALGALLPDYSTPASLEMMRVVSGHVENVLIPAAAPATSSSSASASASMSSSSSSASAYASEPPSSHEEPSASTTEARDKPSIIAETAMEIHTYAIRLQVPLLGGFTTAEALSILPRLVRLLSDAEHPEALANAFRRMFAARPPPLPRAQLFAALHRLEIEPSVALAGATSSPTPAAGAAAGASKPTETPTDTAAADPPAATAASAPPLALKTVPLKAVLDSISICLLGPLKDEFKPEALREAIRDLLGDPVPPHMIMRTVILAAQNQGNEMKRFLMTDVIPAMIRKKIWAIAPKVWEGVCHAVKIYADHKNAEPTLRCILGLPKAQLKTLLKIAPKASGPLGKLLNTLSANEKDECTTGRWAGIASAGDVASSTMDAEKTKMLKEMASAASGSS